MEEEGMIRLEHVSFAYPDHPVLEDISLTFLDGQISAVLGRNGSGKSTLIRLLLQELQPQSGELFLDEERLDTLNTRERAKKAAFLLQQSRAADLSVRRMVLHGRFCHLDWPRTYNSQDLTIAKEAMEETGILSLQEKSLQEISGGELQKVLLARMLAQQSSHLLLDEPNTWLDIAAQRDLLRLLEKQAAQGACVVLVLHDLIAALEHAQKLFVLDQGKLVFEGTPQAFCASGIPESVFGISVESVCLHGRTRYVYSD